MCLPEVQQFLPNSVKINDMLRLFNAISVRCFCNKIVVQSEPVLSILMVEIIWESRGNQERVRFINRTDLNQPLC